MDYIALAFRFVLASVFILAGLAKLRRRREFEQAVRRYELVPPRLARPIANWLPPLELACGVLLAIGLATTPVALLLAALLVMFSGAVMVNLVRGREIDCGCFSAVAPRRITWLSVVRNLVLATMAGVVALGPPSALALDQLLMDRDASMTAGDAVAVLVATTLALVGLALASEGLRYWRVVARLGLAGGGTS